MAKVFTPEQVLHDKIPDPSRFETAAGVLLDYFDESYFLQDEFKGALVFGSTTTGQANIRSDLDILISYKAEDSWFIGHMGLILKHLDKEFNIPVEPILYNRHRLTSGEHTIDPIFSNHLQSIDASKWGIRKNPAKNISLKEEPWTDVFDRYSLHKESKFKKALLAIDSEVDYKVLQRAYEIPSALGRKALALLETGDESICIDPHSASKQQIIKAIGSLASPRTLSALERVTAANNEYDQLLERTIGGSETRVSTYAGWLRHSYAQTIGFALDYTVGLSADVKRHLALQQPK